MKKCLKTFIKDLGIKFPLSQEMLLYYLSLGYICICKHQTSNQHFLYIKLKVSERIDDMRKNYFSIVKLTPLSISDIKFLLNNLTAMRGGLYYIQNKRDVWVANIETNIENIKIMLNNEIKL